MTHNRIVNAALVVAVAGAAGVASAGVSDVLFRVEASNQNGSGFFEVGLEEGTVIDDLTFWSLANDVDILDTDTGAFIARLEGGNVTFREDPISGLGFAVRAGASNTSFTITSGLLSYAPFVGEGTTSASLNVTDTNGDGVTATGDMGGFAWRANYNGGFPGGSNFASLITGVSAGSFGSDSISDAFPAQGVFAGIGLLSDQAVRYGFTLTAEDTASGNGVFATQVPAPAGLLALAGIGLVGRRRR